MRPSRRHWAGRATTPRTRRRPTEGDWEAGKVHELAGDDGCDLAQFAAELSRQSGKPVAYRDLPEAEYRAMLVQAGLPDVLADVLADADHAARTDALFDRGWALSTLIGRPTTPMRDTVAAALAGR